jgi:signal peptidase II
LKKYLFDYAVLFLIAGTVILLDQLSKTLVRFILPLGGIFHPEWALTMFVRIVNVGNRGAVVGVLSSMQVFLSVLPLIVGLVVLVYFPRIPRTDWQIRLALGLLLGGALGNLLDRLYQGYITDFISLGSLPIFNLADLGIALGVVIVFARAFLKDTPKPSPQTVGEIQDQDAGKPGS